MKVSGIVRHIDELGRVVIPKEMRKSLGISEGDPVEMIMEGDKIILGKHFPTCIFCQGTKELMEFKGKKICNECAALLQKK